MSVVSHLITCCNCIKFDYLSFLNVAYSSLLPPRSSLNPSVLCLAKTGYVTFRTVCIAVPLVQFCTFSSSGNIRYMLYYFYQELSNRMSDSWQKKNQVHWCKILESPVHCNQLHPWLQEPCHVLKLVPSTFLWCSLRRIRFQMPSKTCMSSAVRHTVCFLEGTEEHWDCIYQICRQECRAEFVPHTAHEESLVMSSDLTPRPPVWSSQLKSFFLNIMEKKPRIIGLNWRFSLQYTCFLYSILQILQL